MLLSPKWHNTHLLGQGLVLSIVAVSAQQLNWVPYCQTSSPSSFHCMAYPCHIWNWSTPQSYTPDTPCSCQVCKALKTHCPALPGMKVMPLEVARGCVCVDALRPKAVQFDLPPQGPIFSEPEWMNSECTALDRGPHQRARAGCEHRHKSGCHLHSKSHLREAFRKRTTFSNITVTSTKQKCHTICLLRCKLQELDEFEQCCRLSELVPLHWDQPYIQLTNWEGSCLQSLTTILTSKAVFSVPLDDCLYCFACLGARKPSCASVSYTLGSLRD